MSAVVASIVEGIGETKALPILIRRVAHADEVFDVKTIEPFRRHRSDFRDIKKLVETARFLANGDPRPTGLVILADADRDCPKHFGEHLRPALETAVPGIHVGIVLAKEEYEAWFLASLVSLRGVKGVLATATPPADAEAIAGAKEHLKTNIDTRTYSPAIDQAGFTQAFAFDEAEACRSFRKCRKEIRRALGLL